MNKEELLKAINELPKVKTNIPISAMDSISVDDLMSAIDRLDKTPTYQDLLKENKQLKDNWNKLKEELKENYENYKDVEDECLRTMAQEDDIILFLMSCIEKGDSNE